MRADLNGFRAAVKIEPTDRPQPRRYQHVRRVPGEPGAGDAILHHVEGLDHHARNARPFGCAEQLVLERSLLTEYRAQPVARRLDRDIVAFVGPMTGNRAAAT